MNKTYLLSALLLAGSASAAQILQRGNEAEPSTLDPQLAQGMAEMNILRDMFVGLVDEDNAARLISGAAESWEVSEDGKTYTFKLRRDAKWSDGKALTAEDFVYAWQRAVDPNVGSKYSFFLYPVVNAKEITEGSASPEHLGVKALDDYTLQVQLKHSTPYFLGMLVNAVTYPVPKHVVEKHGKEWTRPEHIVSNGAFQMEQWVPQANITLKKSPSYYDAETVKLDQVIYRIVEDKNAEFSRYRAGEIDITADVSSEQLKWIQQNIPNEFKTYNYLGTYYYGFNLTKAPFKDNPKLREALTLVVDREKIVKNITGSGEKAAYNYVVPEISNYDAYVPAYANEPYEKRLERAKVLYAEAGYSKENPFKVEVLYNTSDNNKKISIALAAMWKESLGVEVSLVNKEWKAYLNDRRSYNTQVFRGSWIGDYDDANTFLDMFVSGGGSNTIGLNDEAYDALIEQAAQENDLQKRKVILRDAEKHLLDQYALIPIYFFISKHLIKPYVKGYELNVMNHLQSKYIYLQK